MGPFFLIEFVDVYKVPPCMSTIKLAQGGTLLTQFMNIYFLLNYNLQVKIIILLWYIDSVRPFCAIFYLDFVLIHLGSEFGWDGIDNYTRT